jgi:Protein of unknown function (DUF1569)
MKTLASPEELDAICERVAVLEPGDAGLWGLMTVHQMICHVTDTFGCPLGEKQVKPFKMSSLPVPVLKRLALWSPVQWPKGVPTTPEMNQDIGGTPPVEFEADRAALLAKLKMFTQSKGPWEAHPIFGAMSAKEWMRWGYLHTDHHLRQFGR